MTKIYKGYKVHQSKRKGSSFSFYGYISISQTSWNSNFTLNHEIGHEIQRRKYGNIKVLFKIYIPSVIGFWKSRLGKLKIDYHKQPWEAEANKLSGNPYWNGAKDCPPLSAKEIERIIKEG